MSHRNDNMMKQYIHGPTYQIPKGTARGCDSRVTEDGKNKTNHNAKRGMRSNLEYGEEALSEQTPL
jgi:hypothetical protein